MKSEQQMNKRSTGGSKKKKKCWVAMTSCARYMPHALVCMDPCREDSHQKKEISLFGTDQKN